MPACGAGAQELDSMLCFIGEEPANAGLGSGQKSTRMSPEEELVEPHQNTLYI